MKYALISCSLDGIFTVYDVKGLIIAQSGNIEDILHYLSVLGYSVTDLVEWDLTNNENEVVIL